jgi:DNA-binding XRE family transcriptional regulator
MREVWMEVKDRDLLRKRRIALGLTQYELAALCRCTQATISGLETGGMTRCSEDLAVTLARLFDRGVEELFVRKGDSRAQRPTNAVGNVPRPLVSIDRRRGPRIPKEKTA